MATAAEAKDRVAAILESILDVKMSNLFLEWVSIGIGNAVPSCEEDLNKKGQWVVSKE